MTLDAPAPDVAACELAGEHVITTRHTRDACMWDDDPPAPLPAVDLGIADTRALDAIAAVVAAPAAADAVERIRAILRSVNR